MLVSLAGALLTLAVLLGIIRLVAPTASRSGGGLLPNADRGVDRHIKSQTERRGAVLAALAAGSLVDALRTDGAVFGGAMAAGVVAAACFRFAPRPTGMVLGTLGTLSALHTALGTSCAGVEDERRVLASALTLIGLLAFTLLRLMFKGAGFARGVDPTWLVLFGLIQLSTFVAAPFGLALVEVTGLGNTLTAVIIGYFAVVAGAALLPEFAVSIVGIALLAATVSMDTVVGSACDEQRGTVVAVLVGFALVWWLAGLPGRRSKAKR